MLRAITVDDELSNHVLLKRLIEKNGFFEVVGHYTDPLHLIAEIQGLKPDVIFLDIEMPVMSGLEVAEKLIPICPEVKIVFVTAYSQYAVEAFRVNALDYLLKPIDPGEMDRVIQKLLESIPVETELRIELNTPRINCLGEFSVYGARSAREVQWATTKVEELLAYLLRNSPQAVSKGELCHVLWQETDEEKGLVSLYTTVYRLRKSLFDAGVPITVHSNKRGYQVETAGCIVDYHEFEKLTDSLLNAGATGNVRDYLQEMIAAEKLFKGELFSNRGYLWSAPYAETINQRYRALCYELYEFYKEQRDYQSAAMYMDNLLQVFPDEEKACMNRMEIYAVFKNQSAAKELYLAYTHYLRAELDVIPSPEFEKHYASLFG